MNDADEEAARDAFKAAYRAAHQREPLAALLLNGALRRCAAGEPAMELAAAARAVCAAAQSGVEPGEDYQAAVELARTYQAVVRLGAGACEVHDAAALRATAALLEAGAAFQAALLPYERPRRRRLCGGWGGAALNSVLIVLSGSAQKFLASLLGESSEDGGETTPPAS